DHLAFRRRIEGQELSLHHRQHHFPSAHDHVPVMPPAARFREDLVQKRSASGAKERDLDERIFFFEAIHGLFALIQSHRRVINDLPFFFGPFDKFWLRLPLRPRNRRDHQNGKNKQADSSTPSPQNHAVLPPRRVK